MSKLSDKEKTIFYVTIAIVSLALLDRLFLGPALGKLNLIDQEIKEQKNVIKRDLRFLSHKGQIIKKSQVFEKYFSEAVEDDDVVNADFLSQIEKLATQSEVNLVKSNPSRTNKEELFTEYFANLDCSGDLKNMISFMHKINSSQDLLKIVRMNMTPKRGTPTEVNASMTIVKMIVTPDFN